MKKFACVILVLTLMLSLGVSCGQKNGGSESYNGVYTSGDKTYVFIDGMFGGALVYSRGEAVLADFSMNGDIISVAGRDINKGDLQSAKLEAYPDSAEKDSLVINNIGGIKTLVGTVEGDTHSAFVIPTEVGAIAEGAFLGTSVKAIVITAGDELTLDNGCLKNDNGLAVIISADVDPNKLSVAKDLLNGTENVTFYIEQSALSTFKSHYNWSSFKDYMKGF